MDLSRAAWRKVSRSTSNGGNCVEIASVPATIAIRDSKNPDWPKLIISHRDFRRFTDALKDL